MNRHQDQQHRDALTAARQFAKEAPDQWRFLANEDIDHGHYPEYLSKGVLRAYLEARADEGCTCGPHSDNPAVQLLADFGDTT